MIKAALSAAKRVVEFASQALTVLFDGGHPRDEALVALYGGTRTKAGVAVNEEAALSISAFFCGVSFYAETIGSLPLRVFRARPGGGRDLLPTNPADRLLHIKPSPAVTAKILRRQLEFDRWLWGNAYARIHWDPRGAAYKLTHLPARKVQVLVDDEGLPRYRFDSKDVYGYRDVLHIPAIAPDGVMGKSIISWAREQLGEAIAEQDHAAAFFGNGAVPLGILEHPGALKPGARANIREEWNQIHQGGKNAGNVGVLWEGMKYTTVSMPMTDAQFLESRQFSVTEISRWLNLPPHILKDLTRSTNNNIEHQGIELVKYSILPVTIGYEQEFNCKLLDPPNIYCKHNVDALERGDLTARGLSHQQSISWGYRNRNEVRELEDLNPIEGGERFFVPVNYVPLDRADEIVDKQVEPAPEPAPPADDELEQESPARAAMLRLLGNQLTKFCRVAATEARRAAQQPSGYVAKLNAVFDGLPPKLESYIGDALECLSVDAGRKIGEQFGTEFLKALYDDLVVLGAHPLNLAVMVVELTTDEQLTMRVHDATETIRGELCPAKLSA